MLFWKNISKYGWKFLKNEIFYYFKLKLPVYLTISLLTRIRVNNSKVSHYAVENDKRQLILDEYSKLWMDILIKI